MPIHTIISEYPYSFPFPYPVQHFTKGVDSRRDREKEIFLISKAKIQLNLLMKLGNYEFYRWFPCGRIKENFFYICGGRYRIALTTHPVREEPKNDDRDHQLFASALPSNGVPAAALRPESQFPDVKKDEMAQLCWFGEVQEKDFRGRYRTVTTNILELYSLEHRYPEDDSVERLMRDFAIPWQVFSEPKIDGRTQWHQSELEMRGARLERHRSPVDFLMPNFRSSGHVEFHREFDKTAIVPMTYWSKGENRLFGLYIPFSKPYPLLNLNRIYASSGAKIILTDSIELAEKNQELLEFSTNWIWTSWYDGSKQSASDVDLLPLRKRQVYYLLATHSKLGLQNAYETAIVVYERLLDIPEVELYFLKEKIDSSGWSSLDLISVEKFLTEAREQYSLESGKKRSLLQLPTLKTGVQTDNVKDLQFLMFPLIPEATTTLIYGGEQCIHFVLSLAYSVAAGCQLLGKRKQWTAPKSVPVLYIDCQFTEEDFKRFFNRIKASYGRSGEENFLWTSVETAMLNFTRKKDQAKVERWISGGPIRRQHVRLLVLSLPDFLANKLDNQTLKDFFSWCRRINHKGCAVLLSAARESLDIEKTLNAAPGIRNVIHLESEKPSFASKSAILVKLERGCDASEREKPSFRIESNLGYKGGRWKVFPGVFSRDNLDEQIRIWSDEQRFTEEIIAEATGYSISNIRTVKQKARTKKILELAKNKTLPEIAQELNLNSKLVKKYMKNKT